MPAQKGSTARRSYVGACQCPSSRLSRGLRRASSEARPGTACAACAYFRRKRSSRSQFDGFGLDPRMVFKVSTLNGNLRLTIGVQHCATYSPTENNIPRRKTGSTWLPEVSEIARPQASAAAGSSSGLFAGRHQMTTASRDSRYLSGLRDDCISRGSLNTSNGGSGGSYPHTCNSEKVGKAAGHSAPCCAHFERRVPTEGSKSVSTVIASGTRAWSQCDRGQYVVLRR